MYGVCDKNKKYRTRFQSEKYIIGRLHVLLRHVFRLIYFHSPKMWSMYIWHGIQQLSRGNNNYCAITLTVLCTKTVLEV